MSSSNGGMLDDIHMLPRFHICLSKSAALAYSLEDRSNMSHTQVEMVMEGIGPVWVTGVDFAIGTPILDIPGSVFT